MAKRSKAGRRRGKTANNGRRSTSIHRSSSRTRVARQQLTRSKAIRVLAEMRHGVSMAVACRQEHIKTATFRRLVGNAVRQDRPGSRFHATKTDRLRREVRVLTPQGPKTVSVSGITTARRLGVYLNAVAHFNRTGDESRLRPFQGKTFRTAGGGEQPFITDPDTLIRLAEAEALHLDSLYASVGTSA